MGDTVGCGVSVGAGGPLSTFVAAPLSVGAGLLGEPAARIAAGLFPTAGEFDGVSGIGVVAAGDGVGDGVDDGVPDGVPLGGPLAGGDAGPLDAVPPDSDVLGEQLGVDPVDPLLELP